MAVSPPSTITFAIWGPIARSDLPGLCERVCALLTQSGATVALCDVAGVAVDAVTVDALARLQLAARRQSCRIQLRHASGRLRDLVAFMGLQDVLAIEDLPSR
jgi:ABC-type transporter Mla MlaB component